MMKRSLPVAKENKQSKTETQTKSWDSYPTLIKELSKDLHEILKGVDFSKEKYSVWDHVPNLGYRYEAFIDLPADKYDDLIEHQEEIINKYNKASLEVSMNVSSSLVNKETKSVMISTLWKKKGGKHD